MSGPARHAPSRSSPYGLREVDDYRGMMEGTRIWQGRREQRWCKVYTDEVDKVNQMAWSREKEDKFDGWWKEKDHEGNPMRHLKKWNEAYWLWMPDYEIEMDVLDLLEPLEPVSFSRVGVVVNSDPSARVVLGSAPRAL